MSTNAKAVANTEIETEVESITRTGGLSSIDVPGRIGEILFGLIMVLTFTGSLSVSEVVRDDVREMLIGALGCNLAWGIIDALFYLMNSITERGRKRHLLTLVQKTADSKGRQAIISSAIPEWMSQVLKAEHFNYIEERLIKHDPAKTPARLPILHDLRDAFYIFTLVFLSTFPVAIPFILITDAALALRLSNLIAVILLFASGYTLGRYSGQRPLIWGISTAFLGAVLVSLTIALGG